MPRGAAHQATGSDLRPTSALASDQSSWEGVTARRRPGSRLKSPLKASCGEKDKACSGGSSVHFFSFAARLLLPAPNANAKVHVSRPHQCPSPLARPLASSSARARGSAMHLREAVRCGGNHAWWVPQLAAGSTMQACPRRCHTAHKRTCGCPNHRPPAGEETGRGGRETANLTLARCQTHAEALCGGGPSFPHHAMPRPGHQPPWPPARLLVGVGAADVKLVGVGEHVLVAVGAHVERDQALILPVCEYRGRRGGRRTGGKGEEGGALPRCTQHQFAGVPPPRTLQCASPLARSPSCRGTLQVNAVKQQALPASLDRLVPHARVLQRHAAQRQRRGGVVAADLLGGQGGEGSRSKVGHWQRGERQVYVS